MAQQVHRAAWQSRGWMKFVIPDGEILHLGGPDQTPPDEWMSGGDFGAASFLAAGIPQNTSKTAWAEKPNSGGHTIKHADILIASAGPTDDPHGRSLTDGSVPTTALGRSRYAGDAITLHNSPAEIFNFKICNRSGGDMVVEVEPFE